MFTNCKPRIRHGRIAGTTHRLGRNVRPWLHSLEDRTAPAIFTVANTLDTGAGSLRQAILESNTLGGADSIIFDSAVFATTKAIVLTTGELAIIDSVTITGPGSSLATVNGNKSSRLFNINGAGTISVNISGLTMSGGSLPSSAGIVYGACILIDNEVVTISNSSILNNTAYWDGGAIGLAKTGGDLTISNCTLNNNTSTIKNGGAIYTAKSTTLVVENSNLTSNFSGSAGGAISSSGTTTVENSSLTSNSASGYLGGAISSSGTTTVVRCSFTANKGNGAGAVSGSGGTLIIRESGFSGNSSVAAAGAIRTSSSTTISITNSTISGNTAESGAGACYLAGPATIANSTLTANKGTTSDGGIRFTGPALNLESTILAGNLPSPDLSALTPVLAKNCAIGTLDGVASFTDLGGNLPPGIVLKLGPFATNGGSSKTHALLAGSPCIDRGSNPAGLTTDQRGAGFARVDGVLPDIGAFEAVSPLIPVGKSEANARVTTAGGSAYAFAVTYYDANAIDVTSLDSADVRVTGPNGFDTLATFVSVDTNTNGAPRTATYQFTPPGGTWDGPDDGVYALAIEPGQVQNTAGKTALPGGVGFIQVLIPRTLVVTNTNDSGPGTLRQAILDSNAMRVFDSIVFDPTIFAGPQTINSSGPMSITDPVLITGPAAGLTIDANLTSGIFSINVLYGTSAQTVTINGLTLTRSRGSAIYDYNVSMALANVTITECTYPYSGNGGAVAVGFNAGSLNIADSVFSGNMSGGSGGAIYSSGASISLIRCTFSSNKSGNGGGAISFSPNSSTGTFTMTDCAVVNNSDSSSQNGGGLLLTAATAIIRNSTIWGNSAIYGGAIRTGSNLVIQNSTIANNIAAKIGGGVSSTAGTITLTSTIVANNVAPFYADVSGKFIANNCLIGNTAGATITGSNNLFNVNSRLQPLADNGSPTLTCALGFGSPCIDAGSNPANLINDQRGPGFSRVVGVRPDIGAVEGLAAHPSAAMDSFVVTAAGATTQLIKVTYSSQTAIAVSTLNTGDITVTGPNGFVAVPTFVTIDDNTNGSPRTATYQFSPPGGSWDPSDYGVFTVSVNASQVFDFNIPLGTVQPGPITTIWARVSDNYVVDLVADEQDGNYSPGDLSLREALLLANLWFGTPDTITFDPVVFGSATTMTLTKGVLGISDALTIVGPDPKLTIDAQQKSGLFRIDVPGASGQPVSLSKLSLVNGKSLDSAGGITNVDESLVVSQVQIMNCQLYGGYYLAAGGIAIGGAAGSLTLLDSIITGNAVTANPYGAGGIIAAQSSTINITRCLISGNSARLNGGGVSLYQGGSLTITDSTITANTCSDSGGGGVSLYNGGALSITNSTIAGNTSTGSGGGVWLNKGGSLKITNSTVAGNTAGSTGYGGNGGGVCLNQAGSLTITNSNIVGNSAVGTSAGNGGGICLDYGGLLNIIDSTIAGNSSGGKGGGGVCLYQDGSATITHSTIIGNTAAGNGGGVWNYLRGSLTITDSTVAGNSSGGNGGGINLQYFGGELVVVGSTISGNVANLFNTSRGGGVYIKYATSTFRNTTVSGNSGKFGAGLWFGSSSGSTTLQNTSVVFNTATTAGGGVLRETNFGQTITMTSTLVAKNSAPTGADISGVVIANYSLIGNTAGATLTGSNNKLNVDPTLRPLADNGGLTKTHALLLGSPAINTGSNPAGVTTDQRGSGYLRTFGTKTDIGAFEVQAPPRANNVAINAGAAQRSRVTSVQVSFNSRMTLPAIPADAFRLARQSDNAQVTLAATVDNSGPTTAVTLSFIGGPVEFGSLADGRYTLTVVAGQAVDPSLQLLDGDGDGSAGGDYLLVGNPANNKLFRLFGDSDGNGTVDQADFGAFRAAINTSSLAFDFDGSGLVTYADLLQFRNRFNIQI